MISSLQHERHRIAEAITQLQVSQHLLDTILATVRPTRSNFGMETDSGGLAR
jgi:hypothetical protein